MNKEEAVCKESISFGDDYGDNVSTFHCQLPKGHKGKHKETGTMHKVRRKKLILQPYILEWEKNEKRR